MDGPTRVRPDDVTIEEILERLHAGDRIVLERELPAETKDRLHDGLDGWTETGHQRIDRFRGAGRRLRVTRGRPPSPARDNRPVFISVGPAKTA